MFRWNWTCAHLRASAEVLLGGLSETATCKLPFACAPRAKDDLCAKCEQELLSSRFFSRAQTTLRLGSVGILSEERTK